MSWYTQLPQYFGYVLPISIGIMLGALAFVGAFYQGWADQYLAMAFSKVMVIIFFVFSILNCFFVSIQLYTLLSTTPWTIFVWELIFTWMPFFTLSFILYSVLGMVFDREARSDREYRDKVDRLDKRAKRDDKHTRKKQEQYQKTKRGRHR